MRLYSTNNKNLTVDLKTAVMQSLAPDKGLYMPQIIPALPTRFFDHLPEMSLAEIGIEVTSSLVGDAIPREDIDKIVTKAINFPAPLVPINDQMASLELWHGPSLAFKDFGARYMAQLMSYFIRGENRKTTILVATSGDTGGAVAAGFYKTPGIEVIILYPSGKVSELQEKQLTTLGENIHALEINGTFDDCQALVKEAFLDPVLSQTYNLSSANSINIARLIPQSFYYFEAYRQISDTSKNIVFSVPSGNFGNLTAGLMSKKMGLPIHQFIAATNVNDVVPQYLQTGEYKPQSSLATISNAMDVGNPSNFVRILNLFNNNHSALSNDIKGFSLNDAETILAMKDAYHNYNYITDPHGAIAYQSLKALKDNEYGVFLETAHPAKFLDTVNKALETTIDVPLALLNIANNTKLATQLSTDFDEFKAYMMSR